MLSLEVMETLSLVQDPDPLERLSINGYQKVMEEREDHLSINGYQQVMEEREEDLLRLQNLELFPSPPTHPPPSYRGSVSSLSSESYSPFSPLSVTSPMELSPGSLGGSCSIMPSPIRLKPSEVLQVGPS